MVDPMKNTCDHCGKLLSRTYGNSGIVWCAQCVRDNTDLLVDLGVIERKYIVNLMEEDQYSWGQENNLVKLRQIPPWDFAAKEEPASEPVKPKENPPHIEEPKFDFAAYNGLSGRSF
jgi:hypothetical protein